MRPQWSDVRPAASVIVIILIIAISAIVAWKELPKSARQWWEFLAGSVPRFYTIGAILFFAIMASEVLASLGLDA
ncbi:hypothetical protein DN508_34495, partial [Burkholderia multivorans]